MSYKYLGLLTTALLLAGLWFVVWRWPQGKHMTFSQHAAQHKSATIYYFFLFALTLPLLDVFFIAWFVPRFGLTAWFSIFAVAASVFQIACTLVPEIKGWRARLHQVFAGTSALLLLPLPAFIASSPLMQASSRLVAAAAFVVMAGVIVFVARTHGKHTKPLFAQIVYFAALFVPILFSSYL